MDAASNVFNAEVPTSERAADWYWFHVEGLENPGWWSGYETRVDGVCYEAGELKVGPKIPSAEALANGVLIPRSDLSRIAAVLERSKGLAKLGMDAIATDIRNSTGIVREIEAIETELTACLSLLPKQ